MCRRVAEWTMMKGLHTSGRPRRGSELMTRGCLDSHRSGRLTTVTSAMTCPIWSSINISTRLMEFTCLSLTRCSGHLINSWKGCSTPETKQTIATRRSWINATISTINSLAESMKCLIRLRLRRKLSPSRIHLAILLPLTRNQKRQISKRKYSESEAPFRYFSI